MYVYVCYICSYACGMTVHVGAQRLSYSIAFSYSVRQDSSRNVYLTNSARLAHQLALGICLSLSPLCWDCRCGPPLVTFTKVLRIQAQALRLVASPLPGQPFPQHLTVCKDQEAALTLCISLLLHFLILQGCVRQFLYWYQQKAKKHWQSMQMSCQRRSVGRNIQKRPILLRGQPYYFLLFS